MVKNPKRHNLSHIPTVTLNTSYLRFNSVASEQDLPIAGSSRDTPGHPPAGAHAARLEK